MGDILIRGGIMIDGTGSPGRRADVRIRTGRIVEVAPTLASDGERVLDASGCYVSPGFIDVHTHLDPTMHWDATCDPMPQHGVTSVLTGNCALSLAPLRAHEREELIDLFCYIEDLDPELFAERISWDWESFGEYIESISGRSYSLNAALMVGHNLLRLYVMGERAWEQGASDDERAQIAELLDGAMRHGAFGLTTCLGFDTDRDRRPVPARLADDAELSSLIQVLGDHEGSVQYNFDTRDGLREPVIRMAELCRPCDVVNTWLGIVHRTGSPDNAQAILDWVSQVQATGARTYPQITPRPLDFNINWSGGMSMDRLVNGWFRVVQATDAEKVRLLRSDQWRLVAREEWDRVPRAMIPHQATERLRLLTVARPENAHWLGATLADLVAARGGHPSDVLADWLLENDLRPGVVAVGVANEDPCGVGETLAHPAGVIGNSDAGAHVKMMCAAGDSTLLLARHVRDRADLTIEQGIHKITGQPAEVFGFHDRGKIRVGAYGDLTVFDLDALHWDQDVWANDLPGGRSRLRRPEGGYRATIVAGQVTQEDGTLTEARPGRILRH